MNLFDRVSPEVRNILDSALDGHEVSWQDALRLCHTDGLDFQALIVTADELRRRQVGDIVTYVVNRNVNFTNVCVKHCGFCAFSRTYRNEQGTFFRSTRSSGVRPKQLTWALPSYVCRPACHPTWMVASTST